MSIEQALFSTPSQGVSTWLARSPGFVSSWLPAAEEVCGSFGVRPPSLLVSQALFVRPLNRQLIAIVRVLGQASPSTVFRLLVLPRTLYDELGSDPFRIDDAFEPDWNATELPTLTWKADRPIMRTVAELERVLNVADDRCAWLLGATQAIVDGGRVVVERTAPDEQLLRDLWMLLPYATRSETWLATYSLAGQAFHVVVVAPGQAAHLPNHVPEHQAGDYPDGRYELALQLAVENTDQPELERLLTRRSRSEMVWIAILLLVAVAVVALVTWRPTTPASNPPAAPAGKEAK